MSRCWTKSLLVSLGVLFFALSIASPALAKGKEKTKAKSPFKYSWMKAPGKIAGEWKVTCPASGEMTIVIETQDKNKAVGKIGALGTAAKYGYVQGQEILKLEATPFGTWKGQLLWRNMANVERSDPITMVVKKDILDATQTTDNCYRNMTRLK